MIKNVLIISSNHTGHGHKSIAESLCEKVKTHHSIQTHVVDGFSLGGPLLQNIGKSYGPITRKTEQVWKMIWHLSAKIPSIVDKFIEKNIEENLVKLLEEVNPDLILSVHPNFNGSIINILEKQRVKIPFITLIADLVNIYPLWTDPRVDYIISPTNEAKAICLKNGMTNEQIKVFGFPVRSRFFRSPENPKVLNYHDGEPLKCLVMSGGEGVGNMETIAKTLLDTYNCTVKIVAGRNEKLKTELEQALRDQYDNRVEIYGFTKNIQDLMMSSDIAFTRGSPNVMFEAIASNTPLIITGALPGQEEDNPTFIEDNNLGVVCKNTDDIKRIINELLKNQCSKLKDIIESQNNYLNRTAAEEIVQFITDVANQHIYRTKYYVTKTSQQPIKRVLRFKNIIMLPLYSEKKLRQRLFRKYEK